MTVKALLKDVEVAELLGVSRGAVWLWTRKNKMPKPVRIGSRLTRWRREDVEAMITGGEAAK